MKRFLKIVLLLIILSSSASAQSLTQSNTVELGGDLSFSSQKLSDGYYYDNVSQQLFAFDPYIGFMVTNGFELGFEPGIESDGESTTTFNFYLAPSFNFKTQSNVYPYVELIGGYNSLHEGGSSVGGLGIGGDVGLKIAMKGTGLLLVKVQYLSQSYSESNNNYGPYSFYQNASPVYTINTLSFGVGFRIFINPTAKASSPAGRRREE